MLICVLVSPLQVDFTTNHKAESNGNDRLLTSDRKFPLGFRKRCKDFRQRCSEWPFRFYFLVFFRVWLECITLRWIIEIYNKMNLKYFLWNIFKRLQSWRIRKNKSNCRSSNWEDFLLPRVAELLMHIEKSMKVSSAWCK